MTNHRISDILHTYERIPAEICPSASDACSKIARLIVEKINAKKGHFKLCISSGITPEPLFKELTRLYREGKVSFANVEIFGIDEYYPISKTDTRCRNWRMYDSFLRHVDVDPEKVHIPNCPADDPDPDAFCDRYDVLTTGLDMIVLGIGEKGQIGFNEAGSCENSRTRTVLLPYKSRKRHAGVFGGDFEQIPSTAITIGIANMMSADHVILMAWGEEKASAVRDASEGQINPFCPASFLQHHQNAVFYTDENAASMLTRVVSPWLVTSCEWDRKTIRKAVVWLCQKTGKPILKLLHQDYLENSLGELLETCGSYNQINIDVFNDMQRTITGWPGGKPNDTNPTRPVSSEQYPKRVVIFSPHPDDDVISMGGTFYRLVKQGHDVHVAYETSGNVAVHDDVVVQHIDAARELGYGDRCKEVQELISKKVPGNPEPRQLLDIKAAIRRSEARGAVRSFGLDPDTHAHFLNLPFYESGGIKKNARTQADIDIIKDLLQSVKPHQIYVAGDLADPHGTHRVCTEAVFEAVRQLEGEDWLKECHCWLYRGAWMEWSLDKVDMAVPLSPDELIKKRHAIYRHLSQKDIMPFPGDDPREFWQRAEERTQNTARLYDELGMAEYQAIELFVKHF